MTDLQLDDENQIPHVNVYDSLGNEVVEVDNHDAEIDAVDDGNIIIKGRC